MKNFLISDIRLFSLLCQTKIPWFLLPNRRSPRQRTIDWLTISTKKFLVFINHHKVLPKWIYKDFSRLSCLSTWIKFECYIVNGCLLLILIDLVLVILKFLFMVDRISCCHRFLLLSFGYYYMKNVIKIFIIIYLLAGTYSYCWNGLLLKLIAKKI